MLEADYITDYGRLGTVVADVEREQIQWLWKGRLAFGKITILDGDPGTGKSTLTCDIIARFTTGREFFGHPGPGEPGCAVIVTGEDSIPDTIRPRLEESRADLTRITVLQTFQVYDEKTGRHIDQVPVLPDDISIIENVVVERRARLLVIDPLMAHLASGVNAFKDQDVRRALTPLARLADDYRIVVIIVRHLNKMPGGNPLYRGGGSIGIVGAARTAMLLGRDPGDDDALVLASTKSNLGKLAPSLSLRIIASKSDPEVGVIQWLGESTHSAAALLNQPKHRESPELDRAKEWLLTQLEDGDPHPARQLWERAEVADLNQKTVRRAIKVLGIVVERIGRIAGQGAWYWSLPPAKVDTIREIEDNTEGQNHFDHDGVSSLGQIQNNGTGNAQQNVHLSGEADEAPF